MKRHASDRLTAALMQASLAALLMLALSGAATAQSIQDPQRNSPPGTSGADRRDSEAEVDRRSGSGSSLDDVIDIPRGVIRPPMRVDPGIQGRVPDPEPGTTPVIPPTPRQPAERRDEVPH